MQARTALRGVAPRSRAAAARATVPACGRLTVSGRPLRLAEATPVRNKKTAAHLVAAAAVQDASHMYQRKTPVEHVLLRPGMYIGSTHMQHADAWVYTPSHKIRDAITPGKTAAKSGKGLEKSRTAGVHAGSEDSGGCMTLVSDLAFSPGLLKLFDEILVNACDNMVRTAAGGSVSSKSGSGSGGGSSAASNPATAASAAAAIVGASAGWQQRMTRLDVHIFPGCAATRQRARITIANNGRGIPIVKHATEGIYVPELIFGHLLTGSNFSDNASASSGHTGAGAAASSKRAAASAGETAMTAATGGRHGYGAKLTNIFSHSFTVRIGDAASGRLYTQTWRQNMSVCEPPVITALTAAAAGDGAAGAGAGAGTSAGTASAGAAAAEPLGATECRQGGSFTEISFEPDLRRFDAPAATSASEGSTSSAAAAVAGASAEHSGTDRYEIDAGTLQLMLRRVVDAAGTLARFSGSGAATGRANQTAATATDSTAAAKGRRQRSPAPTATAVVPPFAAAAAGGAASGDAAAPIVSLNGVPIALASFADYARLYTPLGLQPPSQEPTLSPPAQGPAGSASGGVTPAPAARSSSRMATSVGKAAHAAISPQAASDMESPSGAADAGAPTSPAEVARAAANSLSNLASTALPVGDFIWDVAVGLAGLPLPANLPLMSAPTQASGPTKPESSGTAGAPALLARLQGCNQPTAVSFVNNIATSRGGTHVAAVQDALTRALVPLLQKRAPDVTVTPAAVRAHLRLFVSAWVRGASFDSQSKEALSTPIASLAAGSDAGASASSGSAATAASQQQPIRLPERFIRQIADDLGLSALVIESLRAKASADDARSLRRSAKTSESRIKAIPKLEDANLAGSRRGHECTLILTEGDSAKALAVAGLAVVGRDRWGVFPLRGKLLNVRELSPKEALNNAEVSALVSILGLDFTKSYGGLTPAERGLRYGRLMIMADQDVDGSHIKGLLLNLFHTFWPRLLEAGPRGGADGSLPLLSSAAADGDTSSTGLLPTGVAGLGASSSAPQSFLQSFITPIIKARRGAATREFFSLAEFEAWRTEGSGEGRPEDVEEPGSGSSVDFAAPTAAADAPLAGAKTRKRGVITSRTIASADSGTGTIAPRQQEQRSYGEAQRGGWSIKYYKGLGTSTSQEGRHYFSNMARHVVPFLYGGAEDAERLEMAFAKGKADARKAWLLAQAADTDLASAEAEQTAAHAHSSSTGVASPSAAPTSQAGSASSGVGSAGVGFDDGVAVLGLPSGIGLGSGFGNPSGGLPSAASAVTVPAPASLGRPTSADAASPAARGKLSAPQTSTRSASAQPQPQSPLRHGLTYGEFVDTELINFSRADLTRSIPSAIDGLKPSQRKVLFACFKRAGGARGRAGAKQSAVGSGEAAGAVDPGDAEGSDADADVGDGGEDDGAEVSGSAEASASGKKPDLAPSAAGSSASKPPTAATLLPPAATLGSEVKVAQLAGYVAEATAYHHGEASLLSTIVGMAQDYVGSNNVPLLQPVGQFGTRLQGGKDAASARYIFTRLAPLSRLLFPAADDALLRAREDDGQRVEPALYVPVLPLALLNGAAGIGTGWSTSVPPYHPVHVLDAVAEALQRSSSASGGRSSSSGGRDGRHSAGDALQAALQGWEPTGLKPWWRGFNGRVYPAPASAAAAASYADAFVVEGEAEWVRAGAGPLSASVGAVAASGGGASGRRTAAVAGASRRAGSSPSRAFATRSGPAGRGSGRGSKAATGTSAGGGGADDDDSGDEAGSVVDVDGCTAVRISELPVGRWTEDYKAFLADLMGRGVVKGIREYHTEATAEFVVTLTPQGIQEVLATPVPAAAGAGAAAPLARSGGGRATGARKNAAKAAAAAAFDPLAAWQPNLHNLDSGAPPRDAAGGAEVQRQRREQLLAYFRLRSSVSTRNMHMFDRHGRIQRYAAPGHVIQEFMPVRLGLYAARQAREVALLQSQLQHLDAVHGFLGAVVAGDLRVSGRSKAELIAELRRRDMPLQLKAAGAATGARAEVDLMALAGAAAHLVDPAALNPGPLFMRPSQLPASSMAAADAASAAAGSGAGSFDYLLQLPLWRLTRDSMQRTAAQAEAARQQLQQAQRRRAAEVWQAELQRLRDALLLQPEFRG